MGRLWWRYIVPETQHEINRIPSNRGGEASPVVNLISIQGNSIPYSSVIQFRDIKA